MAAHPSPSAAGTLHETSDRASRPIPAAKASGLLSLLRARKLDRTLTSVMPAQAPSLAPFPSAAVNQVLRGGMPRGQLSEICGAAVVRAHQPGLGRAGGGHRARGVDGARGHLRSLRSGSRAPRPASRLPQLLWVRGQALSKTAGAVDPAWVPGVRGVSGPGTLLERTIDRAIKALNLIVQSGVCTMVVLDLIDVPAAGLSRIPRSTWLRIQRVIEGSDTAVVLLASMPVARSAGGLSIALGATPAGCRRGRPARAVEGRPRSIAPARRPGHRPARGLVARLVGQLPLVVG